MTELPSIDAIRRQLARPATTVAVGGFRPTGRDDESWLGRVFLNSPGETHPVDPTGNPLVALAQIHVPSLPYQSDVLVGLSVLTVFISIPLPEPLTPMGDDWVVREYEVAAELVRDEQTDGCRPPSALKPFPLRFSASEDFPVWDGGVPRALEEQILKLESDGAIDGFGSIGPHIYGHKFGGWPSFHQSGGDIADHLADYEFVFQIDSDSKACLNVVDGGTLTFWKHRVDGRWAMYYDFL